MIESCAKVGVHCEMWVNANVILRVAFGLYCKHRNVFYYALEQTRILPLTQLFFTFLSSKWYAYAARSNILYEVFNSEDSINWNLIFEVMQHVMFVGNMLLVM